MKTRQQPAQDHDEHVVEWARHEWHEGRRPEWTPEVIVDALMALDAGNRRPLASYVRAHGVPLYLRGLCADLMEEHEGPTRLQARITAMLQAMASLRRLYRDEKQNVRVDPAYRPHFTSIRAIQEHVAERFLGSADQWRTVEKLEQRHRK